MGSTAHINGVLYYGTDYIIECYLGFGFGVEDESSFSIGYIPGLEINIAEQIVPIPGAALLFGTSLLGIIGFRRKFRK